MNNPSSLKEIVAKEIIAKNLFTNYSQQIIDSRGFPTVEVELMLEPKFLGRRCGSIRSFTGKFEALELGDGDK